MNGKITNKKKTIGLLEYKLRTTKSQIKKIPGPHEYKLQMAKPPTSQKKLRS